jgi:diguanylate cyclase (GGDEF)-like protein/PAS domain S-box-containing protein
MAGGEENFSGRARHFPASVTLKLLFPVGIYAAMHILLVDDSPASVSPLMAFLRQLGYRVTLAPDGRAAVAAHRATPADLVLIDMALPELEAIEITHCIKQLSGARWVPVILMTASGSKEDIVAVLNAGADDALTKPIVFEVLAARLRSLQRIAVMQDSLVGILDNVYEAILTIDQHGVVQSYNKAAETIFGYSAAEVIGANVKSLMPPAYAEHHDGFLARYVAERTPRVIGIGRKVQGQRKNGEVFPMRLAVTEVRRNGDSLFIGLVNDISEEERARQKIEFLALYDALTGLPNRAHYNDVIEALMAAPGAQTHALLFIDLDGFKPINDTLGHAAGDEALKVVAERLRHALAANDFVARLGGDEFVVIARAIAGPQAALTIAERLLESIGQPMTLLGQPSRMGASIGIALLPQGDTRSASEILSAADNAMYAAKRGGKGRAVLGHAA